MSMSEIVEKYFPKNMSQVVGNTTQIRQLKDWLTNYTTTKKKVLETTKKKRRNVKINVADENSEIDNVETNSKSKKNKNSSEHSCVTLIGDHGVGKTCTIKTLLKDMGYVVNNMNLTKLNTTKTKISKTKNTSRTTQKNTMDHTNKLLTETNIFEKLVGKKNEKFAIIIDDLEIANSPNEKNLILSLLKKNEEIWYCPIIFISSGKHSKLMTVLKRNTYVVTFTQPTIQSLEKMVARLSTTEHVYFDNETVIKKIIDYCQKDIRKLILLFGDLKLFFSDRKYICEKDFDEYCEVSKNKDMDVHIFKASAQLILNYNNIDDCLRLYEGEKVIIPLVLHQNYINCIILYDHSKTDKIDLVNDLAKSIAIGDLIENYIYSDQNWDLQEVHGFLTCVKPSFYLSNENLNTNPDLLGTAVNLGFPIDLNRTSIKCINHRNIVNSNVCLKTFEIKDFMYANRLVRKLIEDDKMTECSELFNDYKMSVGNIESVLKIDKINQSKTTLASQTKKKLTNLLDKKTK